MVNEPTVEHSAKCFRPGQMAQVDRGGRATATTRCHHALKVETRVRTPLGVHKKVQFRRQISGSDERSERRDIGL